MKLNTGTEINQVLSRQALLQANMEVKKYFPHLDVWLVHFPTKRELDTKGGLSLLKKIPEIRFAQLNHKMQLRSNKAQKKVPSTNDDYFSDQWALKNTGQTGGMWGADIRAESAWSITDENITVNGDEIIIAVIDNIFDLNHEDLNFWKNTDEIPNNDIDDDGNGYVDDYDGWNVYDDSGDFPAVIDPHGTHVSGITAVIGFNGEGIHGVAHNTRILPVAGSSLDQSDVVAAYDYVLTIREQYENSNGNEGAFIAVTNSSFGNDNLNAGDVPLWCAMYDTLGTHGIVNVAAVANESWDVDDEGGVPETCTSDYLITVTSTDHDDKLSPGSAYGDTHVDLGAPGEMILSTVPIIQDPPPQWGESQYGYDYGRDIGTSMAAPHVSGTAALMFANMDSSQFQDYENDPANMVLQIKDWILDSVDPVSGLNSITFSGGRLNAYKALLAMHHEDPPPPAPENLVLNPGPNFPSLSWDAVTEADSYAIYRRCDYGYYVDCTPKLSPLGTSLTNTYTDWTVIQNVTAPNPEEHYQYAVRAVNEAGSSRYSNRVDAFGQSSSQKQVNKSGEDYPEKISMAHNYPNPFNPYTMIRYELPVQSVVNIEVFDMLGRRVAVLVDETKALGTHSVIFNAASLSSGVYIARFKVNGSITKDLKMQLIK
ncbi:MAG: S8 family serine peptidase [Gracilimonas sp.]